MSKFVVVNVLNGGGEYTSGIVSNKDEIDIVKDAFLNKNDCSRSIYFVDKDGNENSLEHFNYNDKVSSYGPSIIDSQVSAYTSDIDFEPLSDDTDILSLTDIEDTDIFTFSTSNPFYSSEDFRDISEESLIWSNYQIEKRIHYPILVELHEDENFDFSNLFIGSVNLDETLSNDEIVDTALYIRKDEQKSLAKQILKDDFDETDPDFFSDIILEYSEYPSLFSRFECEIGDIEGKGEFENDYNRIDDIHGNTLFECGDY